MAEIAVRVGQGELAYRRSVLFARSMLAKTVEYGLATEEEIIHMIDHELRDELVTPNRFASRLMIAQWARKRNVAA